MANEDHRPGPGIQHLEDTVNIGLERYLGKGRLVFAMTGEVDSYHFIPVLFKEGDDLVPTPGPMPRPVDQNICYRHGGLLINRDRSTAPY